MAEKKLTGKIAQERIRLMETPPPPEGLIAGFRSLGDSSGIVSDVMDEIGITGVIGAPSQRASLPYFGRPIRKVILDIQSIARCPDRLRIW